MRPTFNGLAWGVLLLSVVYCSKAAGASLVLASKDKTEYVITVPSAPAEPVRTVAKELQSYVQQVTGVELPIVADNGVSADARLIVVGPCKQLEQLMPQLDLDSVGHDGIVMKTVGDDLILAGQGPRGTLYAVYTFLEDVVGCRWWTSTESYVPKKPVLEVPELDIQYTSACHTYDSRYCPA